MSKCQILFNILFLFVFSGLPSLAQDLPNPAANIEPIEAGAYIIPMDVEKQFTTISDVFGNPPFEGFNLGAYGLVYELLDQGITVKWVIRSGKNKDEADFTANVTRLYPTMEEEGMVRDFRTSAFVIEAFDINIPSACNPANPDPVPDVDAIISNYANDVKVYILEEEVDMDVRYTLTFAPQISILNDGWDAGPYSNILDAANVPYEVISNVDFLANAECQTFASQPHIEADQVDAAYTNTIETFLVNGGNFFAQCSGVTSYENEGLFVSTDGIISTSDFNSGNNGNSLGYNYTENDLAIMQFDGEFELGLWGTVDNFDLAAGSAWESFTYLPIVNFSDQVTFLGADVNDVVRGGNLFYLGGHELSTGFTNPGGDPAKVIQMQRTYMNAAFMPANINFACAGNDICICADEEVTLGCSSTLSDLIQYTWSPAEGLSCTECPNPVASPDVTTTYTMTPSTGNCGTSSVTVTIIENPPVPVNVQFTCSPDNAEYVVSFFIEEGDEDTYVVLGNGGNLNGTQFISDPIPSGESYSFDITDARSCATPLLGDYSCNCDTEAIISGGGTVCGESEATIQIDLVGTPSWFVAYAIDGAIQPILVVDENPFTFTTPTIGTYTLINVTDPNCAGIVSGMAVVEAGDVADASILPIDPLCTNGETATLVAASPGGIWSGTGITDANIGIFDPALSGVGTHPITYTIEGECGASSILDVVVNEPLNVDLGENQVLCEGTTTILEAPAAEEYLWSNGETTKSIEVTTSNEYAVTVTQNGCESKSEVNIDFETCNSCVVVTANAFSPNDDTVNETFKPVSSTCDFATYTFEVFNRWGEKIFTTTNPDAAWNGTFNNQQSDVGVYVYYVKYTLIETPTEQTLKGFCTLVR